MQAGDSNAHNQILPLLNNLFKNSFFRNNKADNNAVAGLTDTIMKNMARRRGAADNPAAVYRGIGEQVRNRAQQNAAPHSETPGGVADKQPGVDPESGSVSRKTWSGREFRFRHRGDCACGARLNVDAGGSAPTELLAYSHVRSEWVALSLESNSAQGEFSAAFSARIRDFSEFVGSDGQVRVRTAAAVEIDVSISISVIAEEGQPVEEVAPVEDVVFLDAGDRVLLRNSQTGETLGVRMDADGNIAVDFNARPGDDTPVIELDDAQSITFEGPAGQGVEITAGSGNDWDIDVLSMGETGTVYVDNVGYGNDHVNIINSDNGEQTSFHLGCLIQGDELADQGDDVCTIRLHTGQSVHIDSTDSADKYLITASEQTGDWEIRRSDEKRGWYFYTGHDVINVVNTATNKTTSFQQLTDGTLVQLDDPVTDGDNVTTYYFTPGTSFNFQPGDHGKPVPYRICATGYADWTIRGLQGPHEMVAYLGEGDVVRVEQVKESGGGMEATYYKLRNGELEVTSTRGEDFDDATTYTLNRGDMLHLRATGDDSDLITIQAANKTLSEASDNSRPQPPKVAPPARLLVPPPRMAAPVSLFQFRSFGSFDWSRSFFDTMEPPQPGQGLFATGDAENDKFDLLTLLLTKLKEYSRQFEESSFKNIFENESFSAVVQSVHLQVSLQGLNAQSHTNTGILQGNAEAG